MSWSLQVSGGDLVVNQAQLSTVANEAKLLQDLRHYLLERMGTDSLHPEYGSLIDGGTKPDGTEVPSPIGHTDWRQIALSIEADIRRIGAAYQSAQLNRAKSDRLRFNRSTLTAGEVLASIDSVVFTQDQDALLVTINITAGSGKGSSFTISPFDLPVITR